MGELPLGLEHRRALLWPLPPLAPHSSWAVGKPPGKGLPEDPGENPPLHTGVPLLRDEAEAQRRGPLSRGHTVRQGARPDSGVLATLDGFRVWGNLDLGPSPHADLDHFSHLLLCERSLLGQL